MKKLLSLLAIIGCTAAHAQFNPSSGFSTINNTCGTYFLQGSTYYNNYGVNIGSTLPVCVPPFSAQNSSAAVFIPAQYTNANLPVCSSATVGLVAIENDAASSPSYNATATGGGTGVVTVLCNGTNWTNH